MIYYKMVKMDPAIKAENARLRKAATALRQAENKLFRAQSKAYAPIRPTLSRGETRKLNAGYKAQSLAYAPKRYVQPVARKSTRLDPAVKAENARLRKAATALRQAENKVFRAQSKAYAPKRPRARATNAPKKTGYVRLDPAVKAENARLRAQLRARDAAMTRGAIRQLGLAPPARAPARAPARKYVRLTPEQKLANAMARKARNAAKPMNWNGRGGKRGELFFL
jgi:hypothetical protein